jgi:hypothetical protein
MDASGLWRKYKVARNSAKGDFRGSLWGATTGEVLANEVENLREGWTGKSTLFGYEVLLRYKFGDRGLRGGSYEFMLEDQDPTTAFQEVFGALSKQFGLPLYLQRARAVLSPTDELPPASLLRSMLLGPPRCVAAWATERSEVLLLMDASAIPLRLNFAARDESLYPCDTDTQILEPLRAA